MSDRYEFEPDLARAYTLPARLYTDPRALEEEKAGVFSRTWQLVGRTEQVHHFLMVWLFGVRRHQLD